MSLTNGNWYTAKVTVDGDGSGGDRLRFWVDTDGDSTWSDENEHFNDTSVIDDWPAGYVGLYVGPQSTDATEFDDVTMWIDNDADGTIDERQFADDFNSNQVTLTYDDNGNLTSDGVFTYVYDGWNRLRKVQRVAAGPTTTDVALYEYFADNRRSEKIVQNSGAEVVENDGGNTTVRFYYGGIDPAGSRWNIVETRNGSNQATFQYVWGTQYIDELVLIDKNLAPEIDVDCDADVLTVEEDDTDDYREGDSRYLVHQNANGDVVALTDYDPAGSTEGAVVERYSYTPYGEVTVLNGVGITSSEFGNVRMTSSVGNALLNAYLLTDLSPRHSQHLRPHASGSTARTRGPSTTSPINPLNYGNWCGLGNPGLFNLLNPPRPIDCVDLACMNDKCYSGVGAHGPIPGCLDSGDPEARGKKMGCDFILCAEIASSSPQERKLERTSLRRSRHCVLVWSVSTSVRLARG